MDNEKAVQQLLKVFDPSRIVSPEDVQAVLAGITTLLASFKKQNEQLTDETKATVDALLTQIRQEQAALQKTVDDTVTLNRSEIESLVQAKVKEIAGNMQQVMDEVKMIMPQDGKDANPADVVPLVLEQIKIPEIKDVVLDNGEQIVEKINALPTNQDEYKIDASHIKGLTKGSDGKTVFTAIRGPETKIYDLSSQLDGVTKTFALPAFRLVFDIRSSSFPYAFRPTVDYTTDATTMQITFTDQIDAASTLAAGQTLYVLYLTI